MKILSKSSLIAISLILFSTFAFADKNTLLSAIGGISASDIYSKYTAIGAIGDGFEKGVYDANFVKSIVGDFTNLNNNSMEHFTNMLNSKDLVGEDVVFAKRMLETYKYLNKEAEALANYSMTKEKKFAEDFQLYRKLAWGNIKLLLGIK